METNTRDAQIKSGVLVHLVDHFCYDDDDNDDGEVVDDNDNVVDDDGDDANNVDDTVVDEKLNLDSSHSEVINAVHSNLKRTKRYFSNNLSHLHMHHYHHHDHHHQHHHHHDHRHHHLQQRVCQVCCADVQVETAAVGDGKTLQVDLAVRRV